MGSEMCIRDSSVTKADGSDFALFDREVLASNGHIHNAMMDQLKR